MTGIYLHTDERNPIGFLETLGIKDPKIGQKIHIGLLSYKVTGKKQGKIFVSAMK